MAESNSKKNLLKTLKEVTDTTHRNNMQSDQSVCVCVLMCVSCFYLQSDKSSVRSTFLDGQCSFCLISLQTLNTGPETCVCLCVSPGSSLSSDSSVNSVSEADSFCLDVASNVRFSVWVSFCEIYNENIHDLLEQVTHTYTHTCTQSLVSVSKLYLIIKPMACLAGTDEMIDLASGSWWTS